MPSGDLTPEQYEMLFGEPPPITVEAPTGLDRNEPRRRRRTVIVFALIAGLLLLAGALAFIPRGEKGPLTTTAGRAIVDPTTTVATQVESAAIVAEDGPSQDEIVESENAESETVQTEAVDDTIEPAQPAIVASGQEGAPDPAVIDPEETTNGTGADKGSDSPGTTSTTTTVASDAPGETCTHPEDGDGLAFETLPGVTCAQALALSDLILVEFGFGESSAEAFRETATVCSVPGEPISFEASSHVELLIEALIGSHCPGDASMFIPTESAPEPEASTTTVTTTTVASGGSSETCAHPESNINFETLPGITCTQALELADHILVEFGFETDSVEAYRETALVCADPTEPVTYFESSHVGILIEALVGSHCPGDLAMFVPEPG